MRKEMEIFGGKDDFPTVFQMRSWKKSKRNILRLKLLAN